MELRHKAVQGGIRLITFLLFSFGIFGVFLRIIGEDPLAVYRDMWIGSFGRAFSIQDTLTRSIPLMLTAVCTVVPAHLGMIVIGNEGALLMGGLGAALFAVNLPNLPGPLGVAGSLLFGAAAGGLWIALVGLARERRGVNPTIMSLLLFYAALGLYNFLVSGPLRDPSTLNKPGTFALPESYRVGAFGAGSVHWGLIAAPVFCLIVYYLLFVTRWGFAARVAGGSERAARLVGINQTRLVLAACFLGGAAAGLAGAFEVAAIHGNANLALYAGYGFAGILVAFAAHQNPLLVIPISLMLAGIEASGGLVQRRHELPDAAVDMFQGLLFIVILCADLPVRRIAQWMGADIRHG